MTRRLVLLLMVLIGLDGFVATPACNEEATTTPLPTRETYSVTYQVTITPDAKRARVRWTLAGSDEIARIRLQTSGGRFDNFEASGTLEQRPGETLWRPNSPYGHLSYTVAIDHRRPTGTGFDSYVAPTWIISRTSTFFPRASVLYRQEVEETPESRARLVFILPAGWDVVTAMPELRPHQFLVESPRHRFDHPRGWLMLGRFDRTEAILDGTPVTIARAQGVSTKSEAVLRSLRRSLPVLKRLLHVTPPRLLVVMGPDPMWRGGLSGEDSLFMHGRRRPRSPDGSNPYLHELFHVLAPFRPAPDAIWVTEGLAEYYSVELQQRIGKLDAAGVDQALRLFARQGVWGRDLTRNPNARVRNNSAPFVMAVLEQRIRRATNGHHGLDDVVALLARERGVVSTAHFLGAIRRVAGRSFGAFFRQHVYRGERPTLRSAAAFAGSTPSDPESVDAR